MNTEDYYFTIDQAEPILLKEKGSKFYGYAFEVNDENDIKAHLHQLYEAHPKARHHCYAWKLGFDDNLYKTWDDGEPSGTAGRPILGQIEKYILTNCFVVVVRYFGGTLLGTSGLIKAYKGAAEMILSTSKIVKRFITSEIQIISNFEVYNKVEQAIAHYQLDVIQRDLQHQATLRLRVPQSTAHDTIIDLKAFISESYRETVALDDKFENFQVIVLH